MSDMWLVAVSDGKLTVRPCEANCPLLFILPKPVFAGRVDLKYSFNRIFDAPSRLIIITFFVFDLAAWSGIPMKTTIPIVRIEHKTVRTRPDTHTFIKYKLYQMHFYGVKNSLENTL